MAATEILELPVVPEKKLRSSLEMLYGSVVVRIRIHRTMA
jgi:hypothetical protein